MSEVGSSAAGLYSWISPPSRSRRRALPTIGPLLGSAIADATGGCDHGHGTTALVIVLDVDPQNGSKRLTTDDQHLLHALSTDRPYPGLGDCVGVGREPADRSPRPRSSATVPHRVEGSPALDTRHMDAASRIPLGSRPEHALSSTHVRLTGEAALKRAHPFVLDGLPQGQGAALHQTGSHPRCRDSTAPTVASVSQSCGLVTLPPCAAAAAAAASWGSLKP